jgi:hypothetical protein
VQINLSYRPAAIHRKKQFALAYTVAYYPVMGNAESGP